MAEVRSNAHGLLLEEGTVWSLDNRSSALGREPTCVTTTFLGCTIWASRCLFDSFHGLFKGQSFQYASEPFKKLGFFFRGFFWLTAWLLRTNWILTSTLKAPFSINCVDFFSAAKVLYNTDRVPGFCSAAHTCQFHLTTCCWQTGKRVIPTTVWWARFFEILRVFYVIEDWKIQPSPLCIPGIISRNSSTAMEDSSVSSWESIALCKVIGADVQDISHVISSRAS